MGNKFSISQDMERILLRLSSLKDLVPSVRSYANWTMTPRGQKVTRVTQALGPCV